VRLNYNCVLAIPSFACYPSAMQIKTLPILGLILASACAGGSIDSCQFTEKTNVIRISKGETLKLGMNGEWFTETDKSPSEEMQVYVVRVLTYKSSCQLKVVPE